MIWNKDQRRSPPPLRFSTDLTHETEAFRQFYSSIMALSGAKHSLLKQHHPDRLLAVTDVEQYGVLNFAFESAHQYFSSSGTAPTGSLDQRVFDIAFACAHARIEFIKQFTLIDAKSFTRHIHPSKSLFICLAYLHNLWTLYANLPDRKRGLSSPDVEELMVPMNAFCVRLQRTEMILSLEDALTMQVALTNFLEICYQPENEVKEWISPFDRVQVHYQHLRENHPLISILLDQLIQFLPISRLWLLPAAPLHFEEDHTIWMRKSQLLFSRRSLPVMMTIADFLANRIFQIKETPDSEQQDGMLEFQLRFNPFALREFLLFMQGFGQKSVANLYPAYFRLLFYYYLVQNHVLAGIEQFLSLNDLEMGKVMRSYSISPYRVGNIIQQFLEDGVAYAAELPFPVKHASDPLIQNIHSMINRLADQGFADNCAFLALRAATRFSLK